MKNPQDRHARTAPLLAPPAAPVTGATAPDADIHTLRDVDFFRGRKQILRKINLRLRPGVIYGILGPNGGGKTTLLDLLCGLLKPSSGEILFHGRPFAALSTRERARKMALVPQEFVMRFGFSVRDVVEMGRHPHLSRFAAPSEADHALVDRVMLELGINELAERPITDLSGGEKQRVSVARALAQAPEVLLLDEATSNLDVYHSLAILGVIRKQREQARLSVIAAIHDLNLASSFCDELIFLKQGRIVAQGRVEEVLTPEIIEQVYGVRARIGPDPFSGGSLVSFRLPGDEGRAAGETLMENKPVA